MTIRLVRQPDEFAGASIHIPTDLAWKHFQELIQRGANLWPDAPPEIKEFADLVTNGKVMQDYYRQAAGVATDARDWCTDPSNCRRCKAPTWDQPNHEHAGIPVGTQRSTDRTTDGKE